MNAMMWGWDFHLPRLRLLREDVLAFKHGLEFLHPVKAHSRYVRLKL